MCITEGLLLQSLKEIPVEAGKVQNNFFGTVRRLSLTQGLRSSPDMRYESLKKRRGWLFPIIGSGEFFDINPTDVKQKEFSVLLSCVFKEIFRGTTGCSRVLEP